MITGKCWSNANHPTWCIFDPPYVGYDVKSYNDKTIDHRELVRTLLRAPFRWIYSEYEHPIYRPLGEPIRIQTRKANFKGGYGKEVEECVWTNFELPLSNEEVQERIKTNMPKVDTAQLIEQLMKERDDIDAAIRALQRTVGRTFAPVVAAPAKRDGAKRGKKKRVVSAATREKLRQATKARWAKQKKSGK